MADYTPPVIASEQRKIDRRRKMAELLASQQDPMQGQMVSGIYVPPSPIQGISNLARSYLGGRELERADESEDGLAKQQQDILANEVAAYRTKSQEAVTPEQKRQVITEAMMSQNPLIRGAAEAELEALESTLTREDNQAARREQTDATLADRAEARAAEEALRRDLAAQQEQLRRDLADQSALNKQLPAPSIQSIVDPLDPTRMISVDTRVYNEETYRAGDKSGVIGVSGKEPVTAKREEKEGQGKELLSNELDNLETLYKELHKKGGITSTDAGALENLGSSIQSSGVGQLAGRAFGTDEQSIRNQIKSSRLMLLNAIKTATGMSSQQMNSNVELQNWLDAVTNPQNDYESNVGIIGNIRDAFLGSNKVATPNGAQPSVDEILKQLGVIE